MPSILTEEQIQQYGTAGYLCPLPGISADEAAEIAADLDSLERREPDLWKRARFKPHLLITRINDLMRRPAMVDAVADLLGPDVLCSGAGHFDKKPHSASFVAWHQDATYWGLSEPSVLSAWLALTPSTRANGCLRVVPGSHKAGQLDHRATYSRDNLTSRGQEVAVTVDEAEAVDLELEPGQFSVHHTMLVHGSKPNLSDMRRYGISLHYLATRVRQVEGRDSASLVRGVDEYHHFEAEPLPARDFDPVVIEFYENIAAEARRRKDLIAARMGGTGDAR
jgi:non-haem Fe2+, alpha-ketoglutarate-dependent halogenase